MDCAHFQIGEIPVVEKDLFDRSVAVLGTEMAAAAAYGARFDAAVMGRLAALPAADDVIVVSHGTVIALFVAAHAGTDGLALWKALGLPAFVVLDRAKLRIDSWGQIARGSCDQKSSWVLNLNRRPPIICICRR